MAWPALLSRPAAAAHAAAEAEAAGAVPDDEMGVAWRVQSGKEAAASVAAAQQLLQVGADCVTCVARGDRNEMWVQCACVRRRQPAWRLCWGSRQLALRPSPQVLSVARH